MVVWLLLAVGWPTAGNGFRSSREKVCRVSINQGRAVAVAIGSDVRCERALLIGRSKFEWSIP